MRKIIGKPIYDRKMWVLALCENCSRAHYVEPHGTTAPCECANGGETEHANIPFAWRDMSGLTVIRDLRETC